MKIYKAEGVRGQILQVLAKIFNDKAKLLKTNQGIDLFLCTVAKDEDFECQIGIIKLESGYLIETYYPNQKDMYSRVWMCQPEVAQFSYLETANPKLKYFDINKNNVETYLEMYAMPEDLSMLNQLLIFVEQDVNVYYPVTSNAIRLRLLPQLVS